MYVYVHVHKGKLACSIPMGKSAVGWVVSHSLKSGWGLARFSKAFSSSFSQWMSRWQFCSISQCPRWAAVSSNCSATCSSQTKKDLSMQCVCMYVHTLHVHVFEQYIIPYLLLALSHGQELKFVSSISHSICQFAQVSSWIRTGTQDEHNWWLWRRLIVDVIKTDDGRSHVLLSHPTRYKVGDGSVHTVHSEAPQ